MLLLKDDESKDGPGARKEEGDGKDDDAKKNEAKQAEDSEKLRKQVKEVIDALVKKHQNGDLTDKKYAEIFGPEYHDGLYTGGFIVCGKAECIKELAGRFRCDQEVWHFRGELR
jgi:hypothetical protein